MKTACYDWILCCLTGKTAIHIFGNASIVFLISIITE